MTRAVDRQYSQMKWHQAQKRGKGIKGYKMTKFYVKNWFKKFGADFQICFRNSPTNSINGSIYLGSYKN